MNDEQSIYDRIMKGTAPSQEGKPKVLSGASLDADNENSKLKRSRSRAVEMDKYDVVTAIAKTADKKSWHLGGKWSL